MTLFWEESDLRTTPFLLTQKWKSNTIQDSSKKKGKTMFADDKEAGIYDDLVEVALEPTMTAEKGEHYLLFLKIFPISQILSYSIFILFQDR